MVEESGRPFEPPVQDSPESEANVTQVRSLKELIDRVTGRDLPPSAPEESPGVMEALPFPFLGLVSQKEMKIALILALVNPGIGGVLLIGPRGTGKTTAVRGLVDLLPEIPRSLCYYGCMPEDVEFGGIDAVCPNCARKYAQGEPLAAMDRIHLIELPLNARLEDVVGGIDERAILNQRMRLRRGILAQADRNLLYVDEVNLLADDIVDALLDAAAQGSYTVRRGPVSATYASRFLLIGSMNPEEGQLRPQIQDRFGLRVIVKGLVDESDRLEAYKRVQAHRSNPRGVIQQFQLETEMARQEIQAARLLLPEVSLPDEVTHLGLELIDKLKIDSLRAEITLFEAARALAAADGRSTAQMDDLRQAAPLALRLRRSQFMSEYFSNQQAEDAEISAFVNNILAPGSQTNV